MHTSASSDLKQNWSIANEVLLPRFLCSSYTYSSSFNIFLACILGFSQLQCDCYYTHNIFSYLLVPRRWIRTHVLWVSELTSSSPPLSHLGCLFWAGKHENGEERQIAVTPRSGMFVSQTTFSDSYICLFFVFSFRNFSFSSQHFSSCILGLLIITIVSTITVLSVFSFFYLTWLHLLDSLTP